MSFALKCFHCRRKNLLCCSAFIDGLCDPAAVCVVCVVCVIVCFEVTGVSLRCEMEIDSWRGRGV